jgi:ABC-type transport system involved in multi-copper enzyme maturation permease subunit
MIEAFLAELKKNKNSRITWITFCAFALAPIMGGVFILILRNPDALSKSAALQAKMLILGFDLKWYPYLSLLTQAVGVGGILLFGFVASWIFGREFSDHTSKDLLALPTSRAAIVHAKFATYTLWCLALALSNLIVGIAIGWALGLPGWSEAMTVTNLNVYLVTTILSIAVGTPVACFAIAGEGYLAPLGFVTLGIVLSQIIAAAGFGTYFPWSIPGLYSGAAGLYRAHLNWLSYSVLIFVSVLGYLGAVLWFKHSDQAK